MSHISELVEFALNDLTKEFKEIAIATTPNQQAQLINQYAKVIVKGARKILTTDGVRHAFDTHGNNLLEMKRGQIGIVNADFNHLPEIINNPDFIEPGDIKKGKKSVMFIKKIGKKSFHVAMKFTGRDLIFATMYIKPAIK
jgi:hypothetical protein